MSASRLLSLLSFIEECWMIICSMSTRCKAFNLKELDDGAREWLHNNGIDSVEPIDLYIY